MLSQNKNNDPKRTVRCRRNRMGIVASSPSFHCNKLKARPTRPKPMNKPMIRADFHGTTVPPSWRAINKQQTAAMSRTIPKGSNLPSFVLRGNCLDDWSTPSRWRNRITRTRLTAPKGTLLHKHQLHGAHGLSSNEAYIQKHHLQLTRSVKAPPMTGPQLPATPKTLTTIAIYSGLFSREDT